MGLDRFATVQLAILTTLVGIAGINLYEDHTRDVAYRQEVARIEKERAEVKRGRLERLFHISQTKLSFIPSVELESRPYDKTEALYRLQMAKGF